MTRSTRRSIFTAIALTLGIAGAVAFSMATVKALGENAAQVQQLKDTGSCNGCELTNAQLVNVKAEKGDLRNADARGANLYGANFRGANLTGANFINASLLHADLSDAVGADLTGATTNADTICPDKTAGPCK